MSAEAVTIRPPSTTSNPKPKPKPKPKPRPPNAPRLIFPLVGPAQYHDDFGEPRPIGHEEGNDIMTPRHTPVVAPEAARVKLWTASGAGCMMYLYGKSGNEYVYLHLNNDLTKHNDNRGKCKPGVSYAPGLKDGQKVAPGQLVGFSGDSGNADGIPHLEYQLRPHGGAPISPYKILNRSLRLLFAVPHGKKFTLTASVSLVSAERLVTDLTGARLRVKVKTLRAYPGGYVFKNVGRTMTIDVDGDAVVQEQRTGPAPAAVSVAAERLLSAKKGQPLVVRTAPAKPTLKAELGSLPLGAASVVLKAPK